jgi:hypothetical protein
MPTEKPKVRLKPIEKTAYHEAGHVVAYHLMGFEVKSVSIIPNETTHGRTTINLFDDNFLTNIFKLDKVEDFELIFRSAVGSYGGCICEYIASGRRNNIGPYLDFDDIDEMLNKLHLTKELGAGICSTRYSGLSEHPISD